MLTAARRVVTGCMGQLALGNFGCWGTPVSANFWTSGGKIGMCADG